jgi:hypothetical protein
LFTLEELVASIKATTRSTACGPDQLHPLFVRHAGERWLRCLLHILNYTWTTAETSLPNEWTQGHVCMLWKAGKADDTLATSFRPIAITSVVVRTCERMIKARLNTFLDTAGQRKLTYNQAGFRREMSTEDQLMRLHAAACHAIRRKHSLPVVFVDIKAAYDRIWLDGLLYKLHRIGVTGRAYRWLKRFIAPAGGRRIRTIHDNVMSDWAALSSGVPQGSVLAPLLFNVYINDLPADINTNNAEQSDWTKDPVQTPMFADDIALYPNPYATPFPSPDQMQVNLQDGLNRLSEWAEKWKIMFSMDKTKLVVFQRPHPARPLIGMNHQFILSSQPIEQVPSYKYLGLHMQYNLRWQTHEAAVLKKINYSSCLISRLCATNSSVTADTIRSISNAIILAQFSYGLAFWKPSAATLRKVIAKYLMPMRKALRLPDTTHRDALMVEVGFTAPWYRQEQIARQTFNRILRRAEDHPARQLLRTLMRKQYALPRPTLSTMHQDICQGTRRIEEMPTPPSNEELRAELRARLHEKLRTSDQGGSLRAILQQRDGSMHLPARGMAPYLYVDDRGTASARALLRFDRLWLPSVRRRIYGQEVSPVCSFAVCQQSEMNSTRAHVITECHQFSDAREYCLVQLAALDPSLNLPTLPIDLALGEVHFLPTADLRKAVLQVTGQFVRTVYTALLSPLAALAPV